MTNLARVCLNWKVLLALAAVGVGIWIIAPNLLVAALPLLLLAACPLSMLLMMWGMKRGMEGRRHASHTSCESSPVDPRDRLAELETKQVALQREITQVKSEIEPQKNVIRTPGKLKEA